MNNDEKMIKGYIFLVILTTQIVIVGVVLGATILEMGVILIVIYIIAAVIFYYKIKEHKAINNRELLKTQNEMRALIKNSLVEDVGLKPTHQQITQDGSGFIQIDASQMKVRIGGYNHKTNQISSRIIDIQNVLGVSVTENGKRIMGTELFSTHENGAISGFRFGGVGNVVDATPGQKSKKITDVSLVLAVDDLFAPFISLNFLSQSIKRDSVEHGKALIETKNWMS